MTWLDDLKYDSDASDASWDDNVAESSVWRGATSPLDGGDWLRELEESLRDDISEDDYYGGVGTNEEGAFGTNSNESDDRLYMGQKKDWKCQRCGKVVVKPADKATIDNCPKCRGNKYLCDKNSGILVDINRGKPRGTSGHYVMARIFHTASMGTPFAIDTEAGSMRVTLRPDDNIPDYPSGTVVYKLAPRSIKALTTQLGPGLVGTVAENVDRSHPEVVVVQPAGGGEVETIENPQFAVLYTDVMVTPVSQNLPTTVDPSVGDPPPPSGRTNRPRDDVDTVEDLFADALSADALSADDDVAPPDPPPPPSGRTKRPRDDVDTVEDLFADALSADDDVAPPPSRQRQSIDVNVYLDYDMEDPPILIKDVRSLETLRLRLNDYNRCGDDDNDVIHDTESYKELTQKIMDDAIASGASLLTVSVYSKDAVDPQRRPSTSIRNVEGMMSGGNPLMMTNGRFANDEEEDDGERDRLVDDDEEEEEEEEEEDPWLGRTALDADRDVRMNTAFMIQEHGRMTLAQYLEENLELLPWADFISPHRLSMLANVANPFLVLSPMFFEGAVSEAERFLNMHINAEHLSGLGLGVASFDKRFLNGIQWDVGMISNAKKAKEERDHKEAEKRVIKERKTAEQEAQRQRRKQEKEEAGMVRGAAKKADTERRIAAAEENRRLKAELKEGDRRRKHEKATMRNLDRLMKPGLKGLETDEERAEKRSDASNRYGNLPWAQASPPVGVARHPETGHPIVFTDVPEVVCNALFWLMAYRLYLHMKDPLSDEMIFRNINRYYGRAVGAGGQRDLSKRQWRSWQLQRKIPGTSGFLGQYIESILAALVNAASIADPRIDSSDSALSWIVWILDPTNAERWLRDPVVVQGLQEQEYHPAGRASSSRMQDKYDAEFRDRNPNWSPSLPTLLEIPDLPIVPPAPPPPLPADPTLPMPPPHPPPAPPSDVGSSAAGSSAAGSSAAGSSADITPATFLPDALMNMDNVTEPVDLHHVTHTDDMSWGLQDALNLLDDLGGNMERAKDIFIPEAGEDDSQIRLNVQSSGATPQTARNLRDNGGVTAAQIVATGLFDVSNLIDVFSIDSLVAAGIPPLDLLHAGGSVTDLRQHLSRGILRDQGFSDEVNE